MDLEKNKSFTPLESSVESDGRPINRNAYRRFQRFLVRQRLQMPLRRRLHRKHHSRQAYACVITAVKGWLSSCAIDAAISAMLRDRSRRVRSSCACNRLCCERCCCSTFFAKKIGKHKPGATPVNVKLLPTPRQSRGFSKLNRTYRTAANLLPAFLFQLLFRPEIVGNPVNVFVAEHVFP